MRSGLLVLAVLALSALPVSAQTADEIIAKYVSRIGGIEKLQAVQALRRAGKLIADGEVKLVMRQENKWPNLMRQEMSMQKRTY